MEIVNIDFKTYIYNSYNILIKTYLSPYKEIIKFIIDKEILINDYLVMSKFENIPKLLSVLKDRTSLCFERINGRTLRIYISEKHDLKSRLDIYTKILEGLNILFFNFKKYHFSLFYKVNFKILKLYFFYIKF